MSTFWLYSSLICRKLTSFSSRCNNFYLCIDTKHWLKLISIYDLIHYYLSFPFLHLSYRYTLRFLYYLPWCSQGRWCPVQWTGKRQTWKVIPKQQKLMGNMQASVGDASYQRILVWWEDSARKGCTNFGVAVHRLLTAASYWVFPSPRLK